MTAAKVSARAKLSDPVRFQHTALHRKLWDRQKQIARAVLEKRSTSIKGCHASGKTYVVSGCVLHHLANFRQGKVITIAPTLRQAKLMWEEIELARRSSQIAFPECSTTGMRISEDRYGIGFSSSKGVNAQGFHGQDVLIIADEAPGISGDVWDAIEGIRAGGRVRLVKLGNPTVPSGPFYEDFTRGRGSTECMTISAFDTPNLQNLATGQSFTIEELLELPEEELEIAPAPFLVTRQWVKEKYLRWGPNNPRYLSRVLGAFPTQSDHAVFDLAWIERAKREPTEREAAGMVGSFIQVGIDVAGAGDDETTACARVNGCVIERGAWADADPRGAVLRWLSEVARKHQKPIMFVVVDTVGIGYNFALHIADNGYADKVYGFIAGAAPIDREQFKNQKAEAYFRLREMYKENYICHLPEALDEECEAQLSSVLYVETGRGLVQIEAKEDARERGVQSPDRAEAQIMAYARVVPRSHTMRVGGDYVISPI